ncbi:hypothetical protein ECNC101_03643 [Escherichia coli NC101]|nr:hypothetical protein ECNC101_03643 [Escherichia coli NC101]
MFNMALESFGLGSELTGTYQPDNTAEFFMGGRKAWSQSFALQHTFHEKNKTLPDQQEN